jgi:hypothetical protein
MLGIAGVDQDHLEPALVQDLEDRDPIDAGGLHGHCEHSTVLEPVCQAMQVAGEGAEAADRLGIPIRSHGGDMHPGTDIDCCRIRMCDGNVPLGAGPLRLGHGVSSLVSGRARLRKEINFLTGIATTASPLSSAQRPMGHVFCRSHCYQKSTGRSPSDSKANTTVSMAAGRTQAPSGVF